MSRSTHLRALQINQQLLIGPLTSPNYGEFFNYSQSALNSVGSAFQYSAAITPRTKMIIVNTPHNPVGKVFSRKELESIAALAEEFNLLVMSDEVVRNQKYPPTAPDNLKFDVSLAKLVRLSPV